MPLVSYARLYRTRESLTVAAVGCAVAVFVGPRPIRVNFAAGFQSERPIGTLALALPVIGLVWSLADPAPQLRRTAAVSLRRVQVLHGASVLAFSLLSAMLVNAVVGLDATFAEACSVSLVYLGAAVVSRSVAGDIGAALLPTALILVAVVPLALPFNIEAWTTDGWSNATRLLVGFGLAVVGIGAWVKRPEPVIHIG